nr:Gag-Pol polyprotein [Tanacetum cinerariifolium]
MFVMICTRPDIAHAVGVVSRYMVEPSREHWKAVKRIFRYIKGTSDVALCYGESSLTVKGDVDSDYVGDLDKSKSTTKYVFTLSGETDFKAASVVREVDCTDFKAVSVVREVDCTDPGENSSQSPPHIDHQCCYGCGDSLDDIFYQRCTCESCGNGAHHGYDCPPKVLIISNPKPCHDQNVDEFPQTLPNFHPICYSGDENSFAYDSTPNLVNDSPNVFNPPLQSSMYSYEFFGNDAQYSHDCPPQIPICYHDDDDEDSSTPLRDIIISELPLCIAITPVFSTKETKDSLIMGDEHLDTIPEKESDEFKKSSIKNLFPKPKSEDEHECDMPVCDDFTTFFNLLFDSDDDFSSKSLPNQDSSIISSSKIDSLLDEFAEEINSENSDAVIESFSLSPIPFEDNDPFMKEIDLFLNSDGSIPPGIDSDYSDSKGDNLFPKRLLNDDPIPLSNILDFSNVV